MGVSYKLLGATYGSARLPSVLAALLVLGIVYALAFQLHGKRTALLSAAMLGSSFLFLSFARLAMSDMLLTLCTTAALACFILALTVEGSRFKTFALLGYVALALGVLAKGPVAIALVAGPIGLELGLKRKRADLARLRLVPGLILLMLIAAPYFVIVYLRAGPAPLRFFFFAENLQRFTGQVYGASGRPVWFELAAFFSDFAPWSVLIPLALWFGWRRGDNRSRVRRLVYLWLGCTIILFSLSSFKLDYYLLPAMPASALIVAPLMGRAEEVPRLGRFFIEGFLVLCSFAIVLITLLSLRAATVLSISTPLRLLPLVVAVLGLGTIVIALWRRKVWQSTFVLMVVMWVTFVTMQWIFLPAFVGYLPATRLAAAVPAGSTIFTSAAANDWANCIAFNVPAPHQVERLIGDNEDAGLLAALRSDSKSAAIIRESEYATLIVQDPRLKILAQAETFGHGGLSLKVIRNPRRERLLLIGR
jgi:4-amino-4-deoxy-L-arabinose transferase-like glycosyltransferase